MRGTKILLAMFAPLVMAIAPVAYSDSATEYDTNGTIAAQIETKLQDYLLQNEFDQISFGVYLQGKNYGSQGQAYVSSSPQQDMVSRHMKAFCTKTIDAENDGGCVEPTGLDAEDAKYIVMGDVKSSVLLQPDTYTVATTLMAQNLIRNITNPFPDNKIRDLVTKQSFKKDNKLRDQYAQYLADQATLGVAIYSMNEMLGMRVPGSTFGLTDPTTVAEGSVMSAMEAEATRRFVDPTTFETFLSTASTGDMQKEQMRMQAFSMWMDYMRYRQGERIEALLAASLSQSVHANKEARKVYTAGR